MLTPKSPITQINQRFCQIRIFFLPQGVNSQFLVKLRGRSSSWLLLTTSDIVRKIILFNYFFYFLFLLK